MITPPWNVTVASSTMPHGVTARTLRMHVRAPAAWPKPIAPPDPI
jgi:hypothetical protein